MGAAAFCFGKPAALGKETEMKNKLGRIPNTLIHRDRRREQTFGIDDIVLFPYFDNSGNLTVLGELVGKSVSQRLSVECAVFDNDDDMIGVRSNSLYSIEKEFYSRYPFSVWIPLSENCDVARITLTLKR